MFTVEPWEAVFVENRDGPLPTTQRRVPPNVRALLGERMGEYSVKGEGEIPRPLTCAADDQWRNSGYTLMAMLKRTKRVALFDTESHCCMVPVAPMGLSRTINLVTVRVAESHSHPFRHPSVFGSERRGAVTKCRMRAFLVHPGS
ncbi:hypothetical protein B0H19DRAFT_1057168 [Mycena capillaripes]|nr:hypothetical protein B0H19DRAFT_1057168 [Mycena capillaripes]